MAETRQYDREYKVQAVKLAKEIGQAKAAKELEIPKNTMYGWVLDNRLGSLDLGVGSQTPQSAMTLNEELIQLRQQVESVGERKPPFEERKRFFGGSQRFFRCKPSEVSKNERMKFLDLKTEDGALKGCTSPVKTDNRKNSLLW